MHLTTAEIIGIIVFAVIVVTVALLVQRADEGIAGEREREKR